MGILTKKLQNIGIIALEEYSFILTELIAEQPGIYALYKGDTVYYIGKAIDLKRRLKQHLKDRHHNKWDKFSLFVVSKEKHISDLESLLITIYDPKGNKSHPKNKAVDLKKEFQARIDAYRKDQDTLLFGQGNKKRSSKEIILQTTYKGKTYSAKLLSDNTVLFKNKTYSSPSSAGRAVTGKISNNGLTFWKAKNKYGTLVNLKDIFNKSL